MFVSQCLNCKEKYAYKDDLCPNCRSSMACIVEAEESVEIPQWDQVDNVKHYQVFPEKDIEAKDIIGRLATLCGLKGDKLYWYLTALKYMLRMGRKGDAIEDAKKARKYLDWYIEDKG